MSSLYAARRHDIEYMVGKLLYVKSYKKDIFKFILKSVYDHIKDTMIEYVDNSIQSVFFIQNTQVCCL